MKCRYFGVTEWFCKIQCPRVTSTSYWMFILLIICSRRTHSLGLDNTTDLFVEKCQMECNLRKDVATCGKYKVARWLNTVVKEKEFSYGPFRIIRMPSIYKQSFLPYLPRSRAFKSGITEALNFVRDSIEDFLTKRAIVYTIDNPAVTRDFSSSLMLMDEDELEHLKDGKEPAGGDWRIFKKKKSIILPVLILINLIKLKLLLLPIFLGVHFIKKLLVLGSLILPSVFAHLKICKVPPQPHHAHHSHPFHLWSTAADTADYPTGYGQDDTNWHRNDYQLGYPSYQILRNPYG
ncbi:hypothetical protein PUN28_016586 [Cardiocondyla obscurior]|uniref:Uncharacterized protein n=1 Tax=Cardiocondyla obscurior TaxID=286306 RepID=A0AAW2EQ57_9HYME